MAYATQQGCQACRVRLAQGSENSIEFRKNTIEKLTGSMERQLVISLFVDGRYGAISTNRLQREEVQRFIDNGIAATRLLEEDLDRTLPPASLYYTGDGEGLEQFDHHILEIETHQRIDCARAMVEEVMGQHPALISCESGYSDLIAYQYTIDSQGFEQQLKATNCGVSASVSLHDTDGARPEAFWYDSSIRWDKLSVHGVGTKALNRAIRKLGQQKIAAGSYSVVVDTEVISELIRPLMRALFAQSLYNKNSFLIDKIGTEIAHSKLSLYDRPHLPGVMGARYFNNEGVATQERTIVNEGILNHYLVDPYYGKKLKMEPTINNISILRAEMGSHTTAQLIGALQKGVYITGFNGGNCNPTTGDFSYGVEGICIEHGELTQPFSEMVLTGNMLQLWKQLVEVGNEMRTCTAVQLPSMLFEGLSLT